MQKKVFPQRFRVSPLLCLASVFIAAAPALLADPATFKVASYNVENYLLHNTGLRKAKSAEARAQVCKDILELQPDVLAIQEMGDTNALLELRASLKAGGLDLPFWEHIDGADSEIHVAVLSRFPFSDRQPHARDSFLLNGRRFPVYRGFAQVTVTVNPHYSFVLLVAHLKSKLASAAADEAELRLEEARILRKKVDALLKDDPEINLIVAGDLNDTRDSASTRALLGRGKTRLVDTRPAERNGRNPASITPGTEARSVTWTQYYAKEDLYSRIDYILASPGMSRELRPAETYILTSPDWGLASDHRPIVATFTATDQ